MKALVTLVILALVAGVFYLYTELQNIKKELKKDQPQVTIKIQKPSTSTTTTLKVQQTTPHISSSQKDLDKVIKEDFQKIFHDIFGNPEFKKQLKDSIKEFKQGLSQAVGELQKQVEELSKNDKFFSDLLKEFDTDSFKLFDDKGDYYQLDIQLHHDKNAKVEINSKNGFLSIKVISHIEQKTQNQVIKKQTQKSYIVQIPSDANIQEIKSNYHDGILTITIPKQKTIKKV